MFAIEEINAIAKHAAATRYAGHADACFTPVSSHAEFEALRARASYPPAIVNPLELLRSTIDGFPGYGGDAERRRSDEYVRSYLGERLADLSARRQLPPELQERIEELVLRAGFADPHLFALRHDASRDSNDGGALAAADATIVAIADRAELLDPAGAADYLDEVVAALDERDAALRAAAAHVP